MANPNTPPFASSPVPPPFLNLPWGQVRGGNQVFLSIPAIQFLQELWASIQGQDGFLDQILALAFSPGLTASTASGMIEQLAAQYAQVAIPSRDMATILAAIQDIALTVQRPAAQVAAPAGTSVFFAQTATVTVANTVTETTLIGAGVGSLVIPANTMRVGQTFSGIAMGPHSATGNPTIQLRVYLNSVVILDTGVVTSGNSAGAAWEFRGQATVRSTGAGGTIAADGFYIEAAGGTNLFGMVSTTPVTIDTTVDQTLNFTVQWGTAAAGNTISCPVLTLQSLAPPPS